jgi:anti-sigma factor RsiW
MTEQNAPLDEPRLHAYLDGELSPADRAEVDQLLARDAHARAYVDGLRLVGRAIVASSDDEAARVPEARFEQIWDEIERTLDRDLRLQKAPAAAPSLWERLRGVLRPLLVPTVAVAGVAAVAVVVVSSLGDTPTANNEPVVASKPLSPEAVPEDRPAAAVNDELAVELPAPNGGPAHIKRIEWSGKSGRISEIEGKRATTTVIWISDDEPGPSERPL